MQLLHFSAIAVVLQLSSSKFTQDFQDFLIRRGGQSLLDQLTRKDLKWHPGIKDTCYGGKEGKRGERGWKILKQPVVIVHGLQNVAERFKGMVDFLHSHGYSSSEVYATTYGDGGIQPFASDNMKCAHVQKVRLMIQMVHQYTGAKKIDVIAYSMGSPIARKAIMGGKCVEGANLGPPMSHLIDSFVSVAGANQGSAWCPYPGTGGICDGKIGLYCHSSFLKDVNSKKNYEGDHVFSIFSKSDNMIGDQMCGKKLSPIEGSHQVAERGGWHDQLMDNTKHEQFAFITKHKL